MRAAACAPYDGGADQRDDEAGVVDRRVVVLDGADGGVVGEVGALRVMPLRDRCRWNGSARRPGAMLASASYSATPERRPLPHLVGQRVEEHDRAHRCGATKLMSRSRSVSASWTRWKSSICR